MRRIGLILAVAAMAANGCQVTPAEVRIDPAPSSKPANDPVPIVTTYSPDIFHSSWRTPEVNAQAEALDSSEVERSLRAARHAFTKYPQGFLKKHLKKVYFVKSMSFYGVPYGGTNDGESIYIANEGPFMGFSDEYLDTTFHHEFSSVLYYSFPSKFPDKAWRGINAKDFKYGENGTDAIRAGKAGTDYDPKLYPSGFLMQYSMASIEDDYNTMAEGLFREGTAIWEAVKHSPRLKKKCDLVIQFYHSIDPRFDANYFGKLAVRK